MSQKHKEVLDKILSVNGGCCYLCDCPVNTDEATMDHVLPKSYGFKIAGNIMPAHQKCNLQKGDRFPTFKEIEKAEYAYAAIGGLFNPRTQYDIDTMTKPLIAMFHACRINT